MGRFTNKITQAVKRYGKTFVRFPTTVFFLAVCSAALIIHQAQPYDTRILNAVLGGGSAGALYAAAGALFGDRIKQGGIYRRLLYSVPAGILAFMAGYLLFIAPTTTDYARLWFGAVMVCGIALVFIVPAAGTQRTGGVFIAYVKAFFIALFFSGVLYLGFWFIFFAIDRLILPISEDFLIYCAAVVFVFFAGTCFISFLPRFGDLEDAESQRAYTCPRFLDILVSYIVVPLAAVVALIYSIYFIRVLATLTWPDGEVAIMMLAYLTAGVAAWYFCIGLKTLPARLFLRVFPFVMCACAMLGLFSVIIRINAYGFTQARYLAVLSCILFILTGAYLIIRRMRAPFVPLAILAVLALSAALPYIGANDTALRSQNNRLYALLEKNNMVSDGAVIPNPRVSPEDQREISGVLVYLEGHDAGYSATKVLPQNFTLQQTEVVFGFPVRYPYAEPYPREGFYVDLAMDQAFDIGGFDTLHEIIINSSYTGVIEPVNIGEHIFSPSVEFFNDDIQIMLDIDGETVFNQSLRQYEGLSEEPQALVFDHVMNGVKTRVYVRRLYASLYREKEGYVQMDLFVLLGKQ